MHQSINIHKIIVNGATGMIGSALVRCAIKEGVSVLCLVRKDSNRLTNIPESDLVSIEYCNINEYCNLNLKESYDVFYHLAWEKTYGSERDNVGSQINNIQFTMDAVRLAKRSGCKKFIGAGSQAEYGIANGSLKPDTSVNPESGYGIAKYTAGKFSRLLCAQLNLQFNWVRFLSIFGQFDGDHTLIMYTIRELMAGRSPEFTKCEQIWDYLYCDDAAEALMAIGKNGKDGKFYPLGSGSQKKLSEYIEVIKNEIDPNINLQFGRKDYYPHQPMYLCADISELTEDTEWKPRFSFVEGIKNTVNWISESKRQDI